MITLHYLNNSRAQRILWLLEELELDYQVQPYQRQADTQLAPSALKRVHPLGKAPVITDGQNTIAESGAIIEYLLRRYGRHLIPHQDSEAYQHYLYWLHFAEGSLMPPLLVNLIFEKIRSSRMPFIAKPVANAIAKRVSELFVFPNINSLLAFIEDHLADNRWFAGERLSGADFQMSFPLQAAKHDGFVNAKHPHIDRFLQAVRAREAYQRALLAGEGYRYDYQHSA